MVGAGEGEVRLRVDGRAMLTGPIIVACQWNYWKTTG